MAELKVVQKVVQLADESVELKVDKLVAVMAESKEFLRVDW